jgi:Arc/MetJ family transcription regulator
MARYDAVWYLIHMKRTNLVLDAQLLEDTLKASQERTYSAAVSRAMEEFVRRARARKILDLAGSGAWEGDLALVREDRPSYGKRKRGPR